MVWNIHSFLVLLVCAAGARAGAQALHTTALPGVACVQACDSMALPGCPPHGAHPVQGPSAAQPVQPAALQCAPLHWITDPSAWASYRPWRDDAVGDWRRANAEVARIGGWRVYARETAPPAQTPTPIKELP